MTPQSEESQCAKIKAHLEQGGTITSLESRYPPFNCIHLPRRIKDLKESGYAIDDIWIKTETGKRVKRWFKAVA